MNELATKFELIHAQMVRDFVCTLWWTCSRSTSAWLDCSRLTENPFLPWVYFRNLLFRCWLEVGGGSDRSDLVYCTSISPVCPLVSTCLLNSTTYPGKVVPCSIIVIVCVSILIFQAILGKSCCGRWVPVRHWSTQPPPPISAWLTPLAWLVPSIVESVSTRSRFVQLAPKVNSNPCSSGWPPVWNR